MRIAIDTGGTFTDCVYLNDGVPAVLKVLSTPDDPAGSVLEAIRRIVAGAGAALQGSHSARFSSDGTESRPGERAGSNRLEVRHGTTIGTNALLERKGARVAFVTTEGFEDTIAIGRQARQDLYSWMATPKPCLVLPELRFGIGERVSAEGQILTSPSEQELNELCENIRASGAESIAISLLFSFANPENERRVAATLQEGLCGSDIPVRQRHAAPPSLLATMGIGVTKEVSDKSVRPTRSMSSSLTVPISISHEILPEFREYERGATVVVNAYLAPKAGGYVQRLESAIQSEHAGSLYVMQSSGGIISGKLAANEPVRTVLSGPAGGVIGAHRVAKLSGFENIIAFDMGGTSTDVSLIGSAGPRTTGEARISNIPISVPMLDIHTVGAGGGSLAWFDRGGILHVGPASAGADPGPICYGRGEQPTVTDANLVLGRLDSELSLAGTVRLDEQRTRRFLDESRGSIPSVEEFAAGIVRVAEAEMEKAIRLISVERGHDPREFTLVCFGGAGPLHACSLARALGIPRVLVPAMPGALSALGILMSDVVRDYSRTVMVGLPVGRRASRPSIHALLAPHFAELEVKGAAEFREQELSGVGARSADLRYVGQGYELNVTAGSQMLNEFHTAHHRRYGHADERRQVEVVNVRLRMVAASEEITLPRKAFGDSDSTHAILKQKRVMFNSEWLDARVFQRDLLTPGNCFEGPAIVHEYSATTVVPAQCSANVDEYSNIVIEV